MGKPVSLAATPSLVSVRSQDETLEQALKLSARELLMRWVNTQLAAQPGSKQITNWGDDFKDSSVLCTLLGIEPAAELSDSAVAALAACAQAGLEFDAMLGSVEMVHTAEDLTS